SSRCDRQMESESRTARRNRDRMIPSPRPCSASSEPTRPRGPLLRVCVVLFVHPRTALCSAPSAPETYHPHRDKTRSRTRSTIRRVSRRDSWPSNRQFLLPLYPESTQPLFEALDDRPASPILPMRSSQALCPKPAKSKARLAACRLLRSPAFQALEFV